MFRALAFQFPRRFLSQPARKIQLPSTSNDPEDLQAFGTTLANLIINEVKKETDILSKQIMTLKTSIGALSDGLGIKFEKLGATYIKDVVDARGSKLRSQVHHRYIHPDPTNTVNKDMKEFEIDLFCSDPFIIAECTTFLRQSELGKLQKFIRAAQYLEYLYGKKPESIFFIFAMNEGIRGQVEALCKANGVRLVEPQDLWSDFGWNNQ